MNRREVLGGMIGVAGTMTLMRSSLSASIPQGMSDSSYFMPNFALPLQDKSKGEPPKTGFDVDPVKITPVAGHVHVLTGPGGNIGVLPGKDGVLLVDNGVPGRTKDIADGVTSASQQPITIVVNTHWHGDHTGGNEYIAKAGGRIIAHQNCRQRLAHDQFIDFFQRKVAASPMGALPVATFNDQATLYHGDESLVMTSVAPAHTDGDIFIHFQNANVLHAGDLFFANIYPFIDYSTRGWIGGMVQAADKMLATIDAQTKIIPGHGGPIAIRDDLKAARDMMATVGERIGMSIKAGHSLEETVASKPTKEFDSKFGKGFFGPDKFAELVYKGLVAHSKSG